MTSDWRQWLGLPHEIGADPREGRAACCLVITTLLLTEAGLQPPDPGPWIEMARRGDYASIQLEVERYFEPIENPELLSFALIRNGIHGLGVGIVVEPNTLLLVHHKKGVIALPIDRLRLLQYNRLRQ
jgi:hypothetical protein